MATSLSAPESALVTTITSAVETTAPPLEATAIPLQSPAMVQLELEAERKTREAEMKVVEAEVKAHAEAKAQAEAEARSKAQQLAKEQAQVPHAAQNFSSAPSEGGRRRRQGPLWQKMAPTASIAADIINASFVDAVWDIRNDSIGLNRSCDELYGHAMLQNHKSLSHDICNGSTEMSNVYCLERQPYSGLRLLCVFENAQLVSYNTSVTNVASHAARFAVDCARTNAGKTRAGKDLSWGTWEKSSMKSIQYHSRLNCSNIVENNVLLYPLWTGPNGQSLYEFLHDFLSLFEALLVLNWNPVDVEALLPNIKSAGAYTAPFFGIVERTFAIRGLRYKDSWFPAGTCFRRLALPPTPGTSSVTVFGGRRGKPTCRSPVLSAVADFTRQLYQEELAKYSEQRWVTLMHRAWAQKNSRYLDTVAIASEVDREMWKNDTIRAWNLTSMSYDPIGKDLTVGIHTMARTILLAGVHGAGLTHALWLPSGAVLLEIFCADRDFGNGHYRTIAAQLGLHYANNPPKGYESDCARVGVTSLIVKNLPKPRLS